MKDYVNVQPTMPAQKETILHSFIVGTCAILSAVLVCLLLLALSI